MNITKIAASNINTSPIKRQSKAAQVAYNNAIKDLKEEMLYAINTIRETYFASPLVQEEAILRVYDLYNDKALEIENKIFRKKQRFEK